MPIEELLALYNCVPPVARTSPSSSRKRSSRTSRNAAALDKTLMPPPDAPKPTADDSEPTAKKFKAESVTDIEANTDIKTEVIKAVVDGTEEKGAATTSSTAEKMASDSRSNAESTPAVGSGPAAIVGDTSTESEVKVKTEAPDDSPEVGDDNKARIEVKKDGEYARW